jgi:beta-lactamase regulating signal transducer with metallopeptidase domain
MNLTGVLTGAFQWTLGNSLQVTPLIVLVLLLPKLMGKKLGARSCHRLGLLVLTGLLLPVAPPSRFSVWNLISTPAMAKRAPNLAPELSDEEPQRTVTKIDRSELRLGSECTLTRTGALVWLGVFATLVGFTLWRYRRWRQLVNGGHPIADRRFLDELERAKLSMGVERQVALAAVSGLPGPAVFGLFRPYVLLPEGLLHQLTPAELQLVLLHELAHVKRNDLLLGWVSMCVQFLHWFNPLAWWALQRLRADRELVCDAMVLALVAPGEHRSYGRVLLKVAENLCPWSEPIPSAAPVVSSKSELKRRIVLIKSYRKSGTWTTVMTVALGIVLAGFTLTRARQIERADTPQGASSSLSLSIDAQGKIRVEGEPKVLTIEEMRLLLASGAAKNPQLVLCLKAAQDAPYTQVIKVLDMARGERIAKISLATPPFPSDAEANAQSADRISKIVVSFVGLPLVNGGLIRTNIHVRSGDLFSPAATDDDVRRLYATGLFYNVRVLKDARPEGTALTYVAQWHPRLMEIRFSGNSKFSDVELSKFVTSRVGAPFRERTVFSDGEAIRAAYETAGYKETVVTYAFELNEKSGEAKVTFKILEDK